ncbi:hypothetical protein BC835DRAFT_1324542, partial [Cytidiella melzeri]
SITKLIPAAALLRGGNGSDTTSTRARKFFASPLAKFAALLSVAGVAIASSSVVGGAVALFFSTSSGTRSWLFSILPTPRAPSIVSSGPVAVRAVGEITTSSAVDNSTPVTLRAVAFVLQFFSGFSNVLVFSWTKNEGSVREARETKRARL